jgi:hypothetical protein
MFRAMICAAIAAVFVAFTAPAPAQARMIDPGLTTATHSIVQDVQYWRHRRHLRHGYWYHGRSWGHRDWRCWHERIRVRRHGHWVWRTVRRCGWRYW